MPASSAARAAALAAVSGWLRARMAAAASSASGGRFRRKHPTGQRLGEVGFGDRDGLGTAGDVPLGPSVRVGLLMPHLGSGLVPVLSGQFQYPLPDETVGSAKPATT